MLKKWLQDYRTFRLKMAGLQRLQHITRESLQQVTDDCLNNGWEQKYICNALGARLSDDRFILRKGQSELSFDWHPQHGGQITGPQRIVKGMAAQFDLPL
ncbi:hypothetical protein QX776_02155 [Alteromonadaceae bacterium BrNp21-10]|nr:hypothetical protein [Alteromonadaceae bacterium BrNp21-10]